MNTQYTITKNGIWWDVRRPTGQREAAYPTGQWQAAMAHAHIAASRDRIRDHKHAELFGATSPIDMLSDVMILIDGAALTRQSDYALAH